MIGNEYKLNVKNIDEIEVNEVAASMKEEFQEDMNYFYLYLFYDQEEDAVLAYLKADNNEEIDCRNGWYFTPEDLLNTDEKSFIEYDEESGPDIDALRRNKQIVEEEAEIAKNKLDKICRSYGFRKIK